MRGTQVKKARRLALELSACYIRKLEKSPATAKRINSTMFKLRSPRFGKSTRKATNGAIMWGPGSHRHCYQLLKRDLRKGVLVPEHQELKMLLEIANPW